jgi:hypothetical protein
MNWWESSDYVKAEKELNRASWLTVCWVDLGNMAEARKSAAQAKAAQEAMTRLEEAAA